MANVTLWGASYADVPAVVLPKTGGGTVTFYENGGGGSGQNIYSGTSAPSSSLGSDGDIYMKMESGGTVEAYPNDYTSHNMNSSSHLGDCIGVSAEDGTSTSNTYSSGSSVTGTADYTFDLSAVPSNATITNVSLQVKAHEENASRSTCTIRAYHGSTAKGSLTTVNGTSNTIYDVSVGSWTRAELDDFVMRLSLGYYGGLIAGATLTVEYESSAQWSVGLTGDADGWSISGSGIYKKTNGTWSQVSSVELDSTITRA